jgi:hypothetical protein
MEEPMPNNPTKATKGPKRDAPKRHVELRPLSTEELKRAKDENAFVVIPADCACVVTGEVFGKLIVF